MSTAIRNIDSLKTIEELFIVDPRNRQYTIEEWHKNLAKVSLNRSTPAEVKQLFENAKNIGMYTYFSYRLHQSSETIAYTALEQALKKKFELESQNINLGKTPKRLEQYMDIALEQGWITDQGYQSSRGIAIARIEQRKVSDIIDSRELVEGKSIPISTPTDQEINDEMKLMGVAKKRLHAGRHVRNSLAHGSGGLAPTVFGTLNCIAEEINQLFPE